LAESQTSRKEQISMAESVCYWCRITRCVYLNPSSTTTLNTIF